MCITKPVFLMAALFLFCLAGYAQTQPSDPPAAKAADSDAKTKEINEKVLAVLEQAARDGSGLRLPLNRAIVFTLAGDLFWNFDEKRARDLFREVTGQLISYSQETEKERADNSARNNFTVFDNSDPRGELLPIIASHDAQMALDILYATRPQKLAEAMAKGSTPQGNGGGQAGGPGGRGGGRNQDIQLVNQELALEQRLTLLAARDDPDKLVKFINDNVAKGVSNSVVQPLQSLYKKDAKKADELAGKVVSALTGADWSANPQNFRVALNLIQVGTTQNTTANPGEKQFKFSDDQDKTLAAKVAAYLSSLAQPAPTSGNFSNLINQALPVIQQYAPDKAAQIKQIQAAAPPNGNARNAQRQALFSATSTPEDILAQIYKMPTEAERSVAYSALGSKISQLTDDDRAKKLLDQIPDEKARTAAADQYAAAKVARSAAGGNLDDARKLVAKLTDPKIKLKTLVSLATAFFNKGAVKDIEAAQALMKEARGMVNPSPEDEDELADLMQVVSGYATVEPDTGFRLMEPIVDQFNEMVNASAVLSKYDRRNRSFKKGELVLKTSGGGGSGNRGGGGPGGFGAFGGGGAGDEILFYRYVPQFQLLGKADIEHMSLLADRFSRTDARTILKLYVVRGFLTSANKPAPAADPPAPATEPIVPQP